jgi:thiol:disulfide interchange protein
VDARPRRIFFALAGMLAAFLLSRFLGTTGFLVLLGLVVVACGVYAGLGERRESGR